MCLEDLRSEEAYLVRLESKRAEMNEDHSFVFSCVGISEVTKLNECLDPL